MNTEHKVTEIFCITDDFCKVFDAQMAKFSFKAERKRKYQRESGTLCCVMNGSSGLSIKNELAQRREI